MTPLHILTCSSVYDIELYHVTIENYLTNLITEDTRWGALPLLYVFWGAAPAEIIEFYWRQWGGLISQWKALRIYFDETNALP
jgi:hypothetical protein